MQRPSTKVVHLFPACNARPTNLALRRREMSRDIHSLQELADQLQHMKAPLRQASDAFIQASTPDIRSEAEQKLDALGALVHALGTSVKALADTMTLHQGPAVKDARFH